MLKKVYENEILSKILVVLSLVSVLSSGVGFAALVIAALYESVWSMIKALIILGVPFVAVTLLRRAINAKRPYELYGFYEKAPKDKQGRSFPSRHAYSSFVISVGVTFVSPFLGGVLIFLSVLLCICRVLLGIHFIRDVVCGGLVGIVSAILGMLILAPF